MNCELGPGSLNLGGQFTERAFSVHRIGFTEYAVVQLLLTHAEVVFQMVQLEVIVACKGLIRLWTEFGGCTPSRVIAPLAHSSFALFPDGLA